MEFEFIRNTLMGEYYVKCSMGHEIVGRWLSANHFLGAADSQRRLRGNCLCQLHDPGD